MEHLAQTAEALIGKGYFVVPNTATGALRMGLRYAAGALPDLIADIDFYTPKTQPKFKAREYDMSEKPIMFVEVEETDTGEWCEQARNYARAIVGIAREAVAVAKEAQSETPPDPNPFISVIVKAAEDKRRPPQRYIFRLHQTRNPSRALGTAIYKALKERALLNLAKEPRNAYLIEALGRSRTRLYEDSLLVRVEDPAGTGIREDMRIRLKTPYESALENIAQMENDDNWGFRIDKYIYDMYGYDVYATAGDELNEAEDDEFERMDDAAKEAYNRLLAEMKKVAAICKTAVSIDFDDA